VNKVIECVPNFSEGRDAAVIRQITDAIEGVRGASLLDVDPGESTNRTVVTFVGEPEPVKEAAFRAARKAAELIDMAQHQGEHPRFGATDVCPFVPVAGATMDECAAIAREVGRRIGEELGIPVYLYEHAASRPERRNLADVRAGEYEGLEQKLARPEWQPDFGPAAFNRKSGATAVGAREFLIAYNINLNTTDRRYADELAYELRERGRWKRVGKVSPFYYKGEVVHFAEGRFPDGNSDFVAGTFEELAAFYRENYGGDLYARYRALVLDPQDLAGRPVYKDGLFTHLKGVGWVVEDYRCAQVSLNLTNYRVTAPQAVLEAARELAAQRGIVVTGSEIVGVVPFEAMQQAGRFYLRRMHKSTGVPARDILTTAVQAMGLTDVAEFDIEHKVIGLPQSGGPLVKRSVADFVDEVSRDTPAPGGGSIAALAGALGAALVSMVANLSIGKGECVSRSAELCALAERAQGRERRTGRRNRRRHRGVQRSARRPAAGQGHARASRGAGRGHTQRLPVGRAGAAAHRPTVPGGPGPLRGGGRHRQPGGDERCRGRGADGVRRYPGRGAQRAHQPAAYQGPGFHRRDGIRARRPAQRI
jgi:glutamate formiminotransferase/formiminotetrahydrofolate cyclodeaminase